MNICPYCGAAMPNPRRKQCGALPECERRYNQDRVRAFLTRRKDQDGARYEDRYKVTTACLDCGIEVRTRHGAQRCRPCGTAYGRTFGSAAGNAVHHARASVRKQIVPAGPLRASETLVFRLARERLEGCAAGTRPNRRIWVGASCRRCGSAFVCMWTNGLPVYCSRQCSRSTDKVVRRARARGGEPVPYSRVEIFERDRWICQLCGKRVKRSARVPDSKAAVIDHIVPLAAGPEYGGVDAPWNVQCAHFLCNSLKRDLCAEPALF